MTVTVGTPRNRVDFDPAPFLDFMASKGLRWATADLYVRYVRPALNAGCDPADHDGFERYVRDTSLATQSPRRTAWRWWQTFRDLPVQPESPRVFRDDVLTDDVQLVRFGEWLPPARGLAPGSVRVYVSTIRRMAKFIGLSPTREQLDAFLADQTSSYAARFSPIWHRWEEFHREQGTKIADLTTSSHVPDDVCVALHACVTAVGVQLAHLRALTWADLREGDDGVHDVRYLPDPKDGRYYRHPLKADVVAVLRNWSLPYDQAAFVAPSTRGGTVQFSRAEIQAAVQRGALLEQGGHVLKRPVPAARTERPELGMPWGGS